MHELYEGTQHVKEGDFGYRVPVKGSDQLAELTSSFNTMTENLSRLIVVAKEKERLESELEIAREVQSNLFPKNAPSAKNLELRGLCQPARVVSGDYYDFMALQQTLGFAIGDVAGKGISAALADGDHSIDHAHAIEPGERQRAAAAFHGQTGRRR